MQKTVYKKTGMILILAILFDNSTKEQQKKLEKPLNLCYSPNVAGMGSRYSIVLS